MAPNRSNITPADNEAAAPRRRRPHRAAARWVLTAALAAFATVAAPVVPLISGGGIGLAPHPAYAAAPPAPAAAAPAPAPEDGAVPPHVEAAIDKGLEWLAQNQKPDGTWPQGGGSTTAVPSLAVMAFLARGHVPGQGKYGELLDKSIDFVIASQKDTGILSAATSNAMMYEHGISTAMLSEVYGMVDDERRTKIDKVLAKAVKLILDAQKKPDGTPKDLPHTGGWRYNPATPDADISVTGWQLMALRGAANCGASVPKEALEAGVGYVKRSAVPTGGFSYQPGGGPNQARTGTGILSMVMLGQHTADNPNPEAVKGGDYLVQNPPENPSIEFYYYAVYYCSQALYQLGGKYWETTYPKLRDALLKLQQPTGNWGGGGGEEANAGDGYRTAMACLALSVPYRYLPLYQK